MAAKSRGLGSSRVLGKLKASIEKGDFYEAHQMYRILYFRYTNVNKFTEAINLLYEGALVFFDHNQHNSGADLALLVVEALTKGGLEPEEPHLDRLAQLFERLDPGPQRLSFLSSALRWARGLPALHQKVALVLWKEKNYSQARYHFIHAMDGTSCASMLIEYHVSQGYPNEIDLFIAQTVLQYLCLANKVSARVVFLRYVENHPKVASRHPPFLLPLLNFLWFLLWAVDRHHSSSVIFTLLCRHYQPSLARDPTYSQYLSRIGQLFFGLPPPPSKSQGILGNLLSSLCVGGGMEDLEEAGPSSSSSQQQQQDELD